MEDSASGICPLEVKEPFDILKMKCMTVPVLAFTDFEKPFLLETDASSLGLGAVLSQKQGQRQISPGPLMLARS